MPICKSCMVVKDRSQKWITKGNKSGSVRKGAGNKPIYRVSVDQLHSYQPGLFPQFSGKTTSARIWVA